MQLLFIFLVTGLYNGVSKASQCTSQGRYPNAEVEDCRGYTICLIGGVSKFTQYKLTCPMDFVYSHLEQQCTNTTSYKCWNSYNCTSLGNFIYSDSNDCTSYVACVAGLNDIVTARLIDCPKHTIFNTNKSMCVNETDYKCHGTDATGFNVIEVPSLGSLYEFSANVTINSAVCMSLYGKYVIMLYFLTVCYSLLLV